MRPLRCPVPGYLYEITTTTLNGEFLLRPSDEINQIILGVIGRAQEIARVRIHAFVFMSTHYHLLISVRNTRQKSKFMRMLNGNLSKKLNFHHDRSGSMWQRRFRAIGVSQDRETQESRLRYILAHGVKENLVERVADWPGVSAVPWLVNGEKLIGVWTDFTARFYARRRKQYVEKAGDFQTEYEVVVTPLPCWKMFSTASWRRVVRKMIRAIEADAARERGDVGVAGLQAVLRRSPRETRPRALRRKAPWVHAIDPVVRADLIRGLRAVHDAYTEASQSYLEGDWDVEFPDDMFRPSVPPCWEADDHVWSLAC